MKNSNKMLLLLIGVLTFVTSALMAQTNNSFQDTIYAAADDGGATQKSLTPVIRILEGKPRKATPVDFEYTGIIQSYTSQGSFHAIATPTAAPQKNKYIYDPILENKMMAELSNISVSKPIMIKNGQRVTIKLDPVSRVIRVIPSTTTVISGVGPSITNIPAVPVVATQPALITNAQKEAAAKLADARRIWALIKRQMGIELVGGFIGEGDPKKGFLWTPDQVYFLYRFLLTVPSSYRAGTMQIKRVTDFAGRTGVLGYVYAGQPIVHICNWGVRPIKYEETLVHEMAHTWMFAKENKAVKDKFMKVFWKGSTLAILPGNERPTSSYGCSNVYEDFAEAARCFWQDGPKMKAAQPLRYAFMKEFVFKREYTTPAVIGSSRTQLNSTGQIAKSN